MTPTGREREEDAADVTEEADDKVAQVQHVYDFALLERVPEGATSLEVTARRLLSSPIPGMGRSSTVGAVLSGKHIVCTLGRQARGTGAQPHSHPNEQFSYILHGTMMSDIEGDRVFARPGTIVHVPGGAVHTGLACPDDDLVFLAIKDARAGIVGPPGENEYEGPNCFPGFGSRSGEPRQTTSGAIEESRRLPPGPGKRYVYDMHEDADAGSGPASAEVMLDADLRLPPRIRGKLLTGERLHVMVLRFEPGAVLKNYRRDNEQLAFVVDGELEADLDGEPMSVSRRCMLHVPAATHHELWAPLGATVLIAQDRRAL